MTLSACLQKTKSDLKINGIEDFIFEAYLLLKKATGKDRQYLACHGEDEISISGKETLNTLVSRRISGEPLQYILGEWDFCDLTFKVGKGVLVPRPETEILVEQADNFLKDNPSAVVYDLCAGSGAVGLTVAKHNPNAKVYLFEKYDGALDFLKLNSAELNLPNTVIIKCDILNGCPDSLPHPDVILSNPPYICTNEIPSLQKEVHFEPETALDGGSDGLVFYRAICREWLPLIKSGMLLFECGDGQSKDIIDIFKNYSTAQTILYDFNNIDRAVQIIV